MSEMQFKTVVRAQIEMTLADLALVALVFLKTGSPDRKIEAIKRIREFVADVKPIDENGQPLSYVQHLCESCGDEWCDNTTHRPLNAFGLKECKDAVDTWFVDRKFIG